MFRSKTGFLLYISISLIIISGIIFYYTNIIIPDKESKACERLRYEIDINAMPSKSVVILKKEKLAKNTVLSEEIIKESFQILKVPVIFLVNDYIEDINYLKDKVLVESAYQNQQITKNSIKKRENLLKNDERLSAVKMYGIEAYNAKQGNLVDIIIKYSSGGYDIVVPKIQIQEIKRAEEIEFKEDTFVYGYFALTEEDYRDLIIAMGSGRIYIRTYLDDEQGESKKTFVAKIETKEQENAD